LLPGSLRRCLNTTNLIDAKHSGMRQRARRVTDWQNGRHGRPLGCRLPRENRKNYRRISGHEQLWMLKAQLDD
jgi:hypothetical protein